MGRRLHDARLRPLVWPVRAGDLQPRASLRPTGWR